MTVRARVRSMHPMLVLSSHWPKLSPERCYHLSIEYMHSPKNASCTRQTSQLTHTTLHASLHHLKRCLQQHGYQEGQPTCVALRPLSSP